MSDKIRAQLILEILGRPAEHLKKSFEEFIEKLGNEKGVDIIEKKIHEPKELERKKEEKVADDKKLFTSFAEIEADFEEIDNLLAVIFTYMPSNVEILSPKRLVLENRFLSEILTGIIVRLHRYDEVTKGMVNERAFIFQKLREVFGEEKLKEIFGKDKEKDEKK